MTVSESDLAAILAEGRLTDAQRQALAADPDAQEQLAKLFSIQEGLDVLAGDSPLPISFQELLDYEQGLLRDSEAEGRVLAFLQEHPDVAPGLSPTVSPAGRVASPPRRKSLWTESICLAALSLVSASLNWFASQTGRSYRISAIDWWELTQHRLLWSGIVICAFLILAGLLLRALGLVRNVLAFVPIATLVFTGITGGMYAWAEHERQSERKNLDQLFLNHQWVSFESPSFDPDKRQPENEEWVQERRAKIKVELEILRSRSKFDALVTFAPDDLDVAAIARDVGFKAVIMGIHIDHRNGTKPVFDAAKRMKGHVVGYCLGHNPGVQVEELSEWIQELRNETGRPVTATFPLSFYLGERGRPFAEIGDWLFPDIHASWHLGSSPEKALEQTREAVARVTELPRNKPVLLKMISYPSGGAPGLGNEEQREFFLTLGRDVWLPPGVHASLFSSYDLPWKKKRPKEFAAAEYHVGLLTEKGEPKPALDAVNNWPLIQARP